MESDKIAFLFGSEPSGLDPDDVEDRGVLLAGQSGLTDEVSLGGRLAREAITSQIASGQPAEVWETAQRLLGSGLDRIAVMRQLVLVWASVAQSVTGAGPSGFDQAAFVRALARLPLPTASELEGAMLELVRADQPIPVDEVEAEVASGFGFPVDDPLMDALLDRVSEELIGEDGPLEYLAGDLVVEPISLCSGAVMTHVLNDIELDLGVLTVSVDLAGCMRIDEPVLTDSGDRLDVFSAEDGHIAWRGPEGWLGQFAPGDVVAVRQDAGTVSIEVLDVPPAVDKALVDAVRDAYHVEAEDSGLPISVEELVLNLLSCDRRRFSEPQAPLSDLIESAGLELRGGYVAHDPEAWARKARLERTFRVISRLGRRDDQDRAMAVLDCFDDPNPDRQRLAEAARSLVDPSVLDVVADELLGPDDADDGRVDAAGFAELLLVAARRPADQGAAHWLLAVAAERDRDLAAAEAHLRRAVQADPGWEPGVDRLAWYRSDQGRASDAARLWRSLGLHPEESPDLAMVEAFARSADAKIGRNEPCWCGSGRKYKACHLGASALPALPDRVGWICRKAAAYMERQGGDASAEVFELAAARAGSDEPEALRTALADPVVIDLALTEGGWMQRFLSARGALLPDDEALLVASWLLVPRSLYEIVAVRPGSGLDLQDLRSAEAIEVRERTFSRDATVGSVVCARAVSDGPAHQLIGAVIAVPPGREAQLLDVLDRADPHEIAAYIAAMEAPPQMQTREGEPIVNCIAEVTVPPSAETEVRLVLDEIYERDGDHTWVEMYPISDDERILRATLTLVGDRLTIETASEARIDRVLIAVTSKLSGVIIERDEREPLRPGELPKPPGLLPGPNLDPTQLDEAMSQVQDHLERRWCNEEVPALGGLTPRQAASDPTRREALERLLLDFEAHDLQAIPGSVTMRPHRLRQRLGID